MNQFLSEIQEKYTKIVKNANLIGFLNRLVFPPTLTNSQPLDSLRYLFLKVEVKYRQISELPSDGFVDTFMKCNSMPFSAAWAYYGKVLVLVSVASLNGHMRGKVK